jgi:hypothetical protein
MIVQDPSGNNLEFRNRMCSAFEEFLDAMGDYTADLTKHGPHEELEFTVSNIVEWAAQIRHALSERTQ